MAFVFSFVFLFSGSKQIEKESKSGAKKKWADPIETKTEVFVDLEKAVPVPADKIATLDWEAVTVKGVQQSSSGAGGVLIVETSAGLLFVLFCAMSHICFLFVFVRCGCGEGLEHDRSGPVCRAGGRAHRRENTHLSIRAIR